MNHKDLIAAAIQEDTQGQPDHTSYACIPAEATGTAHLLVKDNGIIAGVDLAKEVFEFVDPKLELSILINDGKAVKVGDIVFEVSGSCITMLTAERVMLNFMQRMSGIATTTNEYVLKVAGTRARILDTRKTTPLLRDLEKWAVRIGGGINHRFGLYDMILIKDNHIDFSGSITQAIKNVNDYQKKNNLKLPVEIETRNLDEVSEVIRNGNVNRIMLDNFAPEVLVKAIDIIGGKYETEASGGINYSNIRAYAETGVDYISVGALTHSARILDLSFKATFNK